MILLVYLLLIHKLVLSVVESARILAVFPTPSYSHQIVFRTYSQELARRGHELVIITPNPYLSKEVSSANITEIDVSMSYSFLEGIFEQAQSKKSLKRGVIYDRSILSMEAKLAMIKLIRDQFRNKKIRKLLLDENEHFDLIVIEDCSSYPLIFAHYFDAPIIQFSSFYGNSDSFESMGAVVRHPLYHPHYYRNKLRDYSFCDKVNALNFEYKMIKDSWTVMDYETKILKEDFEPDIPDVKELRERVDLLFVHSHSLFDNNRAVPPNVVYLGALHLQPVKQLPESLKSYLDNSRRGVIYVNLGTNIRPSQMDKDFLDAFIDAFEELPYDILFKFDGDHLDRIPNNVQMQKWFPQRDLLSHHNILVFVTQGGLQSVNEAIDAAVPLVGIPMLSDQWYNVNKFVELGIGVEVDSLTMTKDDLVKAVTTVIEDARKNITRLRAIMRDQPQSPLERAVWWTEYVLRHGGARHLRARAANVAWAEYLMLDVVIPVVLIFLILLVIVLIAICYSCKVLFKISRARKLKVN